MTDQKLAIADQLKSYQVLCDFIELLLITAFPKVSIGLHALRSSAESGFQ